MAKPGAHHDKFERFKLRIKNLGIGRNSIWELSKLKNFKFKTSYDNPGKKKSVIK